MASRNRGRPSLRDTTAHRPLQPDELQAVSVELFTGTDRAAALVGAAMVDASLETALSALFVRFETDQEMKDMFRSEVAPLQDMSAKIRVGRSLALFSSDVARALNIIRNVRNSFAHSFLPLKFEEAPIAGECERLPKPRVDLFAEQLRQYSMTPMRHRFIAACVVSAVTLDQFATANGGKQLTLQIPDEKLPTSQTKL